MSAPEEICVCGLHPSVIQTYRGIPVYVCANIPPEVLYMAPVDVTSQDLRDVSLPDLPGLPDE